MSIYTYSNIGFAKIYVEKTSLAVADLINEKVLPFFDEEGISVLRVLTDRGSVYCGRVETHPYELYLRLNDIEHTMTKPRGPKTNGAVKRLNQTIKTEF
jgi:transposase InsO family protein